MADETCSKCGAPIAPADITTGLIGAEYHEDPDECISALTVRASRAEAQRDAAVISLFMMNKTWTIGWIDRLKIDMPPDLRALIEAAREREGKDNG